MRDTFMTDHQADDHPADLPRTDQDQPAKGSTATATRTQPAKPHRMVEQMPPWRVLLHNDDVNDQLYVIESITKLTPLGLMEAATRTLEAHITGVSLLLVTHQERAELYRDQFRSKGLLVTIEPMGD